MARNYVFVCGASIEKAMEEVRELGVFWKVHTPMFEYKVRVGPERRRQKRSDYLLPGYFFGRTNRLSPKCDPAHHKMSYKLMTKTGNWGYVTDEDIALVVGSATGFSEPPPPAIVKVAVREKVAVSTWAFKDVKEPQEVLAIDERTGELTLTSPLFGGVPMKVLQGASLIKKV